MKYILLISVSFFTMLQMTSQAALADSAVPLDNFHSFGTNLYRAGRPSDAGLIYLKQLGIKTFVDLQGGDLTNPDYQMIIEEMEPGDAPEAIAAEKAKVESLGMTFLNAPMDSLDPVTSTEGKQIMDLLSLIADPKNQPVFIHCEHGKDRTGLIAALYRVLYEQWTPQAAHDEMTSLGHDTIHSIFTDDLDVFFWSVMKSVTKSHNSEFYSIHPKELKQSPDSDQ